MDLEYVDLFHLVIISDAEIDFLPGDNKDLLNWTELNAIKKITGFIWLENSNCHSDSTMYTSYFIISCSMTVCILHTIH